MTHEPQLFCNFARFIVRQMANILNIETSTAVCSVALGADGQVLEHHENYDGQTHATLLSAYIQDVMRYVRAREMKLDAVAVSIGPGSYTGLRIGLSEAKGLAYGTMFNHVLDDDVLYAPMIDARRMEVYTAVYNAALQAIVKPQPLILDCDSFSSVLAGNKVVFMGDGSDKARQVIKHRNAQFVDRVKPVALDMIALSERAFRQQDFADVAYSTPFYLKEFQATVPRNKVLGQ